MKACALGLALLLCACSIARADDKPAPTAGFENLKGLAGTWTATTAEGKKGDVTLKLIADGSALMELDPEADMVSIFHPDDGRLLMTHYCGSKNQPRMQAQVSPDGKQFRFDFIDGTNLKSTAGHMKQMTLTINDKDHLTENWIYQENGGKEITEVWHLTRKP